MYCTLLEQNINSTLQQFFAKYGILIMNASNFSTPLPVKDMAVNYGYVGIGAATILTNLLIFIVFAKNRSLFKKSSFLVGLAIGDFVNRIGLMGIGAIRVYDYVNSFEIFATFHPFVCMLGYPSIIVIGNQISGVMFLFIGLERFLAVLYFDWYYNNWSNKLGWLFTGCAYALCFISICMAFVASYLQPHIPLVNRHCGPGPAVGTVYIIYHYFLPVTSGSIAVWATIMATISFWIRRHRVTPEASITEQMKNHLKKQWNTTVTMCLLSILDLMVNVIPNFLLILTSGFRLIPNMPSFAGWAIQIIGVRGCLNFFIYLLVNHEFRAASRKTIEMGTSVHTS